MNNYKGNIGKIKFHLPGTRQTSEVSKHNKQSSSFSQSKCPTRKQSLKTNDRIPFQSLLKNSSDLSFEIMGVSE